jgi:hypothetical protein
MPNMKPSTMFTAIASDDVATAAGLLVPGDVYLHDAQSDALPTLLQKEPLPCAASYFGSLCCMKLFLAHGMDLFTPDRVCFWFTNAFLLFASAPRSLHYRWRPRIHSSVPARQLRGLQSIRLRQLEHAALRGDVQSL